VFVIDADGTNERQLTGWEAMAGDLYAPDVAADSVILGRTRTPGVCRGGP
jgi:hypothetical protein